MLQNLPYLKKGSGQIHNGFAGAKLASKILLVCNHNFGYNIYGEVYLKPIHSNIVTFQGQKCTNRK